LKTAAELARENFRSIQPCAHGADILEAASKSGNKTEDLVDFSSSINPLGFSLRAQKAVVDRVGQIPIYPDSNSFVLRQVIAEHYGVGVENVVVGNGSTELIYLFADVFLQKGENAIVCAPSFGEYESAVKKAGGKVKHVPLNKDFSVNPNKLTHALTKKTKIIYLCNPNNPTSKLIPNETLTTNVEQALERSILVFLDEDFLEFVEDGEKRSMISRLGEFPNLFVLRSFTKLFGLTGLRVGYGICSKGIAGILMNAKLPWNLNCLGQSAAIAALDDQEFVAQTLALVKEEKEFLLGGLRRFGSFRVFPPDANYLFMDIRNSGLTPAQLKEKLLAWGILIRDCSSFAGLDEFYIRIAVKTRSENERLLSALRSIVG